MKAVLFYFQLKKLSISFGFKQKTAYNCSVRGTIKKQRVMSKQVTKIDGVDLMVATFGLTEEQHKVAFEMIKYNWRKKDNYKLKEVDEDTLQIWCENADEEGYKEFLTSAINEGADVYTLIDSLGGVNQEIGEIAVY